MSCHLVIDPVMEGSRTVDGTWLILAKRVGLSVYTSNIGDQDNRVEKVR